MATNHPSRSGKTHIAGKNPRHGASTGTTSPSSTTDGPTANQILQNSWGSQIDAQTAQQYTGLAQIRQARVNQLQREATALAKTYGANDPGVIAVQSSVTYEQSFGAKLGVVSTTTSVTVPTAPANGWVVYGRVRNADLTPAPQLTVFVADKSRAWLRQYGYAFTDQTGYFALSYAPDNVLSDPSVEASSQKTGGKRAGAYGTQLEAWLEITNAACKVMFIDTSAMSLSTGSVVYRDIVLAAVVPLGTAPCEEGASTAVPPAAGSVPPAATATPPSATTPPTSEKSAPAAAPPPETPPKSSSKK